MHALQHLLKEKEKTVCRTLTIIVIDKSSQVGGKNPKIDKMSSKREPRGRGTHVRIQTKYQQHCGNTRDWKSWITQYKDNLGSDGEKQGSIFWGE